MSRGIDDYRRKRDFERTPEPPPEAPDEPLPLRGGPPVFVVHRHEARNLHYDLRLEMEGVLRSWAVPKGFSYDPSEKRLAVRTEDHPIEYESFSGMIPKGEYGAGAMTIWDRGTWEVVKADDAAAAVAAGELKVVLRGRRLRGEWHLVKTKGGPDHWLLFKSKDRYAGPARDSALGVDLGAAPRAALPGELAPMEPAREAGPFSDPAFVFEVAFEGRRALAERRPDGVRLRGVEGAPEVERELARLRAETALVDGVLVALDEHQRPSRALLDERLAGRAAAELVYYAFDLLHVEEFDLRGLPLLDRKAALRALLPEGSRLLFVDHVAREGEELARAAAAAGLSAAVAKRAGSAWTPGPSEDWVRVRVDAPPGARDVPLAQALEALEAGAAQRSARRRSRVKLTNPDKVYWPREGYTKRDLVAHYERVADVLLPYLHDRPLHMYRWPDGIEGKSFYQHDAKEHTPDWVELLPIGDEGEEPVRHVVCNDRDTLLYLANLGSIDLHPWLSRRGSLDSPDFAVIDLDPKTAPFEHVVRIAREVGRLLRGIGLRPLLKTSGASGLHVYVPLLPGYSYEHSRMFCEGVARWVARELKDIATVERVISGREGKVYVDYGQNRRGQTVVPPWVPRPVPGASVSTPLDWDELDSALSPRDFTIANTEERLERMGDLFRPALTDPQDLLPAIEALQALLGRR